MPSISNDVQKYHVSGEAPIAVGSGPSAALETLGISVDGVAIEIIQKDKAVFSDIGGSEVPVDFLRMGQEAMIDITLTAWNEGVLRRIRNLSSASNIDGQANPRGFLLASDGLALPLAIGAQYEDPWYFPTVKMIGNPQSFKIGTNQLLYKLRFYAWEFIPGNAITLIGLTVRPKLYVRTLTGGIPAPSPAP